MATSKVSLKLLVDKSGKKVLFAEAGKDFVDFLSSLMSMPLGTVTSILTKNFMVGNLSNLYHSIETLNENSLLNPNMPSSSLNVPVLSPNYTSSSTTVAKKLYQCAKSFRYTGIGYCRPYASDDPLAVCPYCHGPMSVELTYVVPPPPPLALATASDATGGGSGTYMVRDDLVVSPMSTISSITLLNKFGVKGIDTLEERVVELGMDEGLELLKESLQSKAVLTSVFLKN